MTDNTQSLRSSNDLPVCDKYWSSRLLWCDLPAGHKGSHEAYLGYNTYESWEDSVTDENAQMRSDINLFINAITYLLGEKEPTEDLAELMNKYRKNDHE